MATAVKAIVLLCPNLRCRTVLSVPAEVRGKKVRCGQCGTSFLVPGAAQNDDSPPAPSDAKTG